MHQVEDTSKISTIIGLIIEGLGMFFMLSMAAMINLMDAINEQFFLEEGFTESETEMLLNFVDILGIVLLVLGGVLLIVFMVNLVLFNKLLNGKFDIETAKKVYLYQIIWGAIILFFNQISGILYLISGIKGKTTQNKLKNDSSSS
jgi:hypothetical protein